MSDCYTFVVTCSGWLQEAVDAHRQHQGDVLELTCNGWVCLMPALGLCICCISQEQVYVCSSPPFQHHGFAYHNH